jgi:hypothetical protein
MRAHWGVRVRDTLSTYLPLLIMVTLALITWWLARHAPQPEAQVRETALRHEPDYIMPCSASMPKARFVSRCVAITCATTRMTTPSKSTKSTFKAGVRIGS